MTVRAIFDFRDPAELQLSFDTTAQTITIVDGDTTLIVNATDLELLLALYENAANPPAPAPEPEPAPVPPVEPEPLPPVVEPLPPAPESEPEPAPVPAPIEPAPVPEPEPVPLPGPRPNPGLPSYTPRLPSDCVVMPVFPMAPTGEIIPVTADMNVLTLTRSNVTYDLQGHRIGRIDVNENVRQVRFTAGDVGSINCTGRNSADIELSIFDLTLDHLRFVGGPDARLGNSIRAGRTLMANCQAIAASHWDTNDGLHNCAIWLDPGSTDLLVQDCDLATYGYEACLRFTSSKRTVVHSSKLTCLTQKHAYRIHGQQRHNPVPNKYDSGDGREGPYGIASVGSWISDCELFNRGLMLGTLPDSTLPNADRIRDAHVKRVRIYIQRAGTGVDSARHAPVTEFACIDFRPGRIDGLVVDDVLITGMASQQQATNKNNQIAGWATQPGWTFTNCRTSP